MRLRDWTAVLVSVVLLAVAGTIGILANRSTVQAADTARRADTRALSITNGLLIGRLQMLAAGELLEFAEDHPPRLGSGSAVDRRALATLAARSETFQYGALLTDLGGTVLTSSRATGLPAMTDSGWAPLRGMLATGQAGFSSVMTVNGTYLQAIAVPVVVGRTPAGALIGLTEIAGTSLQKYVQTLRDPAHATMVVDSSGTIGATDVTRRIGTAADPAIRAALRSAEQVSFVEYTAGGTPMVATVVRGLPGGWVSVRAQTASSFDGGVRTGSRTLTSTLLAMLLIGVVAIMVLGRRAIRASTGVHRAPREGRHRAGHRGGTLEVRSLG